MAKLHDLEQPLMSCWQITDDIDVLYRAICDGPEMSDDETANILLGLRSLYDLKFNNLYNLYEQLLKDHHGLSH
ncbi:MAG: hypothetical protein EOO77_29065 [Oxalobacteraceae bacterium]|nr:MAG: hypothetical protein EOO77_29065 [Oxalobacteraceae bacterium]